MLEINLNDVSGNFTHAQIADLVWINTITSTLAFGFCLVVLIASFKYPGEVTFGMKLIISFIFASMIDDIGNMMSPYIDESQTVCITQGFLRQTSGVSCLIWFAVVSYVSYKQVKEYRKQLENSYKTMLLMNIAISLTVGIL
jgi:hypothetical protein